VQLCFVLFCLFVCFCFDLFLVLFFSPSFPLVLNCKHYINGKKNIQHISNINVPIIRVKHATSFIYEMLKVYFPLVSYLSEHEK
jgi:hypothetical protein